jgi:hypothetical protein
MRGLPKELEEAMERLLDADAESGRMPAARSNVERIDALRAARTVIAQWRKGDVDLAEVIARIEALTKRARR